MSESYPIAALSTYLTGTVSTSCMDRIGSIACVTCNYINMLVSGSVFNIRPALSELSCMHFTIYMALPGLPASAVPALPALHLYQAALTPPPRHPGRSAAPRTPPARTSRAQEPASCGAPSCSTASCTRPASRSLTSSSAPAELPTLTWS